jgi:protoheme IX farnesyltransferase
VSARTTELKNHSASFSQIFVSFYELMKPRVMSLVIFTALVGLVIAPVKINFLNSALSLFFVAIGAGAAGALNMWYESDTDKLMSRTCLRPLPLGKLKQNHALWFGLVMSVISIIGLYYFSNFLSALVLAITIGFYFFIYTVWLKRKTPQNIVIGGAAGAFPPVIGWTIATNNISIEPIVLFLIIFLWTPSHFWALSLYKNDDYKNAGIPMLPVIAGEDYTKKNILAYAIILFPFTIFPYLLGFAGLINLITSVGFGLFYIYLSYELFRETNKKIYDKIATKIFVFSIFYLFFIFSTILIDNYLGV